jgi:AbrB family looped-hinge helix DNA binding protein
MNEIMEPEAPAEKVELRGKATLGDKGRLVIPAALREALCLAAGDVLEIHIENQELRMSTRSGRLRRAQERLRKLVGPDRSIVDEFLAERRAEALSE